MVKFMLTYNFNFSLLRIPLKSKFENTVSWGGKDQQKEKALYFSIFNGTFSLLLKQEACIFILRWALQLKKLTLPSKLETRLSCSSWIIVHLFPKELGEGFMRHGGLQKGFVLKSRQKFCDPYPCSGIYHDFGSLGSNKHDLGLYGQMSQCLTPPFWSCRSWWAKCALSKVPSLSEVQF